MLNAFLGLGLQISVPHFSHTDKIEKSALEKMTLIEVCFLESCSLLLTMVDLFYLLSISDAVEFVSPMIEI